MAFVNCSSLVFHFFCHGQTLGHTFCTDKKKLSENFGVYLKHDGHGTFRVGRRLLEDCEKSLKDNSEGFKGSWRLQPDDFLG